MSHWVRPHLRDGRWVRGHWRRNPGRRSGSPGPNSGLIVAIIVDLMVAMAGLTGGYLLRAKASKATQSQTAGNALSRTAKAGFIRADDALKSERHETRLSMDFDTDCVGHSEGEVRDYFLSHPCKHMARAYIQVGDTNRHLILVAISWVEMPGIADAREYLRLVDVDAGNVIELSRETKRFKNVTYEDRTYMFGIKGTFVWQVEVKPLSAATPDSMVNAILAEVRQ